MRTLFLLFPAYSSILSAENSGKMWTKVPNLQQVKSCISLSAGGYTTTSLPN